MSCDVDEMNRTGAKINRQIKEHVVHNISVEDVIEGVQQLKLDKSDMNCLLYCPMFLLSQIF